MASSTPVSGNSDLNLDESARSKLAMAAEAGDSASALALYKHYLIARNDIDAAYRWAEMAYETDESADTKYKLAVVLVFKARRDVAKAKSLLRESSAEGMPLAASLLKEADDEFRVGP